MYARLPYTSAQARLFCMYDRALLRGYPHKNTRKPYRYAWCNPLPYTSRQSLRPDNHDRARRYIVSVLIPADGTKVRSIALVRASGLYHDFRIGVLRSVRVIIPITLAAERTGVFRVSARSAIGQCTIPSPYSCTQTSSADAAEACVPDAIPVKRNTAANIAMPASIPKACV